MSRKTASIAIIALGILLLLVSVLADGLGIGAVQGIFGWKQVLGAAAGITLLAVGIFLSRR